MTYLDTELKRLSRRISWLNTTTSSFPRLSLMLTWTQISKTTVSSDPPSSHISKRLFTKSMKIPVKTKNLKMRKKYLLTRMIFRLNCSHMRLLLRLPMTKCSTTQLFLNWPEDLTSWLPLHCLSTWSPRTRGKWTSTLRRPSWRTRIKDRSSMTTSMRRAHS
jgi:hypothetical protein